MVVSFRVIILWESPADQMFFEELNYVIICWSKRGCAFILLLNIRSKVCFTKKKREQKCYSLADQTGKNLHLVDYLQ